MSRTKRWWNKPINLNQFLILSYKNINPFYFRHEDKFIRIKQQRALRRNNKIQLSKGWEIEKEQKTNGWLTY